MPETTCTATTLSVHPKRALHGRSFEAAVSQTGDKKSAALTCDEGQHEWVRGEDLSEAVPAWVS